MKTFTINTLGCKVNQYESQQIRQLLQSKRLSQVNAKAAPDLVVINTCCVTHIASSKSRQYIRKARKHNKNAHVIVVGCLTSDKTDELNNIDDVMILTSKEHLPAALDKLISAENNHTSSKNVNRTCKEPKIKHKNHLQTINHQQESPQPHYDEKDETQLETLKDYAGQSRAFLKVQDGCDGYCTYCIIPSIRNKITYKQKDVVIKEASDLIYAGHNEIVLTGIFLGAYGYETVRRKKWTQAPPYNLTDLIESMAQLPNLKRLRLSSLEPADLTDPLLDCICAHPNIVPHLHLPLQSGSQNILKKMCRQYSAEDFCRTVDKLRTKLDRPAITTDIIVGFPTETEEDFKQTIEMANFAQFAKMHVFSFSPRKNTPAEKMTPKTPSIIIKQRSQTLHELDKNLQTEFRKQFIGEKVGVIIENTTQNKGRTERYFSVKIKTNKPHKKGDLVYGTLQQDTTNAIEI